MNGLSRASSLLIVAAVSASLVAFEVLLTRLLSVTAWYGHAFLVLSLAMVGLARGSITALAAQRAAVPLAPWIARRLTVLALGLVLATVVALCTPMNFGADLTAFASVLLVAGAATLPMIAAGAVVARLLAESSAGISLLYAADLAAAALGATLPLVLLGPLSAPAAITLLATLLAMLATALARNRARTVPAACALACAAVTALTATGHAGFELHYTKGVARGPRASIAFELWNPLSHVSLSSLALQPFPLWSPSPLFNAPVHPIANAFIDGEAGTPVYVYRTLADLESLRYDATTSAHALRPRGVACVIGVGGGRDLEAAALFGHDPVLGAEINPAMLTLLTVVAPMSPILVDPRVHIEVGDGRAVLARHRVHCRVLQASLVDTWAATGAGAFAHVESTLYTCEAWSLFLRRVEPDGVLTFSRWYDPTHVSETARLVSLAVASLLDRGVAHPAEHIALVAAGHVATVLVSPAPFSAQDRDALEQLERRYQFHMLVLPQRAPADPLLRALLTARQIDDLAAAGRPLGLDTSAPTDDRPFFFQLLAPRAWWHPIRTVSAADASGGVLSGNVVATLELLVTFFAVLLLGAFLLGPTLLAARRAITPPLPGARASLYFAALGLGFMIAEVALVQRMHVVLGHPTYALIVVLAGLLVATGIGSALSPRVLPSRTSVSVAAIIAAAWLAALPYLVISPLARRTIESPLWVRITWTGACAASVGLVLGMLFPSGLRYVSRSEGTPVALALNGVASVLGSVIAILVSVWWGIPASLVVAGAAYLLAGTMGPWGWRAVPPAEAV